MKLPPLLLRMSGLLLLSLALLLGPGRQRASANLYAYEPLKKIPAPEDVAAFASAPPRPKIEQNPPLPPDYQMSREDLLLFLREGVRVEPGDPAANPATAPGGVYWRGVFFTHDGAAYFWTLSASRNLTIVSTDYRTCYLTVPPSRIHPIAAPRGPDEFHPLEPPKAEDLRWFANADRPGTGFQVKRTRKELLRFLREGKALHYTTFMECMEIKRPARITVPAETAALYKRYGFPIGRRVGPGEADLEISGVFTTQNGKVYFWEQWGDDLLQISDSTGAECALKLR
ncbi:MAG TPA: hypothetical protein VK961_17805 [Chthoniobacter sp.]|nr:hypothetical protein [Chthoniobacter sp.]